MPTTNRFFLAGAAAVVATLAFPLAVQAQGSAMPPMKKDGAAQYVCGGIGSDESSAMRAAMKDHPLSLLFARADGACLSEADVMVKGAGGATALSMKATGPVCLIDLPAGKYTVSATSGGVTKSQEVNVGAGSKTADFRF